MKPLKAEPSVPEAGTTIWRYMDDWKFEDLLATFAEHDSWNDNAGKNTRYFNGPGQLWFSFPWTLAEGDGGEGTFPDANADPGTYCDRMAEVMGLSPEEARDRKERFLAADSQALREGIFCMAQLCGVSCWHENADESAEMWDCIANDNGVAVKTTVGRLERAIGWAHNTPVKQAQPSICAVGYVNHSTFFLESDGFRSLLAIVGESWSYEQEVRSVAKSAGFLKLPLNVKKEIKLSDLSSGQVVTKLSLEEKQSHLEKIATEACNQFAIVRSSEIKGFHLPVTLSDLIMEVVVSPDSASDYAVQVSSLLEKAGIGGVTVSPSSY